MTESGPHPPLDLSRVMATEIDLATKGFPAVAPPVRISDVAEQGWSVDDLPPPVIILREAALAHNVAKMSAFCRDRRVDLAPHGKTTMAPQLWDRQLTAGAWGLTAATVTQARAMREVGVRRILLANEVVDAPSIAWVASQLSDPSFEFRCWVDSAHGVAILNEHLDRHGADRPLEVLVELGHAAGRSGVRTLREVVEVAGQVRSAPRLALAGVAGFEGTVATERTSDGLDAVASFVRDLRDSALALLSEGAVDEVDEVIVSAGGSAFFDVVADVLASPWPAGANVRVVLRSGCTLTHDSGIYERLSPWSASRDPVDPLQPALEVRAGVLSCPEPGLVILGMGKRDAPYDLGLPIPHTLHPRRGAPEDISGRLEVTAMNDQHAFCREEAGLAVKVGDVIAAGISHPCTAFDKWRVVPVVDDHDRVVDAVATCF